jgi:thiamine biosynthesis lipoprotein
VSAASSLVALGVALSLAALAAAVDPAGAAPVPAALVERRVVAMGTSLHLAIEASSRTVGLAASERAVRAIAAAEARLSTWNADSELARQARLGVRAGSPSGELRRDLAAALACAAASDGAFDPTVGPLVAAWDLRGGGRVPSPIELERALAEVGWRQLGVTREGVSGLRPGLIEEGGFGKGAGLDDAAAALRAAGVTRALLDFGGQLMALEAPDGPGFTVAIAEPGPGRRPLFELGGLRTSLATSSNAERGQATTDETAAKGEPTEPRIGHLLDPATGRPVPDPGRSVTVEAASALDADCLATALFVMAGRAGVAAALATADRLGVEALVLEPAGEQGEVWTGYATAGLCTRLRRVGSAGQIVCPAPSPDGRVNQAPDRSAPGGAGAQTTFGRSEEDAIGAAGAEAGEPRSRRPATAHGTCARGV